MNRPPLHWSRLSLRQRRFWLALSAVALCMVVVSGTLLAFNLAVPAALPSKPQVVVQSSMTATTAASVTATMRSATPTATQAHKSAAHLSAPPPPPPPVPTAPPAQPTATPCPMPTAFPDPTATATTAATATSSVTQRGAWENAGNFSAQSSSCQQCPYYSGNNPSQSQIQSALFSAADTYHLPRNLLLAVAWQESKWHEDVVSCDGGIGLMQVQYYTWPWLNGVSVSQCGLSATNYDPNTLSGNANLGAKYLQYLSCFYAYWGDNGGVSPSSPGQYTSASYYVAAGLSYPDSNHLPSFCASVFNDPNNPEYVSLPSTTNQPWSCPYSATSGDNTLLDITLSAYNEGPGTVSSCGICNPQYVSNVEGFIPQFATGALPQ